jgi:hypothetical protein
MIKWLLGSLIVLLLGIGAWLYASRSEQSAPSGTDGTPSLPSSTTTTDGHSTALSGPTITLVTRTGGSIAVPDFTAGMTGYRLNTGTFYSITNNQETQGLAAQYEITYGTDSSIAIALVKEPLSEARLAAESRLRDLLRLSDEEMCKLQVTVGVPYSTAQLFAGKNLGLSFCPGATELP